MLDVILKSFPVFLAIGLGKFFISKKLLPSNASDTVSTITFRLIGPFFIFSVLYGVSIQPRDSYLFIVPLVNFFTILAFAYLTGRFVFKLEPKKLGAMVLCLITFGAGAVYPFVYRNFSDEIFQNFVIVDMLSFLNFLVFGSIVAFAFGRKAQISIKQIAFRFFKDPLLTTMIFTLFITILGVKVPTLVVETSAFFKESFFLMAALLVGISLKIPDRKILLNLAKIYFFRVFLIVFFIAILFGLNKSRVRPFYLVFLAQYSILAVIYSKEQGLDYEFASQLVLFSMVAQLVLYPVAITLLR